MLIYVAVFFFSTLFYKLSQNSSNTIIRIALIVIAILIPSFIAGCRDEIVGRDFLGAYGTYVWDSMCKAQKLTDINVFALEDISSLYVLFNYLLSRFSHDCHFFFFFHELFVVTIIIFVCECLKKKIDSWIFYALFLLYLYNDSFNMLRQIMAVSLGAYSTYLLLQRKLVWSYCVVVLAFFFHSSALLLLTQYPLMLLIDMFGHRRILLTLIICLSLGAIVYGSQFILKSFIDYGLVESRYSDYISSSGNKSNKYDLMYLACMLVTITFVTSKIWRAKKIYNYAFYYTLVSFFLTLTGSLTGLASRAAFYYILPTFFILPLSSIKRSDKRIIMYLLLFFLSIRFLYIASGGNWSDTIPYKSKILGIY